MVVTIHQPSYLPWLGYFDKINRSDVYIFLDTVQFEKNSFTNRNKIKSPQGAIWLTVPLKTKGHLSNTIKDIQIDNSQSWQRKHLKSISMNYGKSPYFNRLYPKLEKLYNASHELFTDLAFSHLMFWLEELGIGTKVVKSSRLSIESKKSELVLDLCMNFKASRYISGALGRDYLDESAFRKKSIRIEYQNYVHPEYPQLYGAFMPNLSIVDFWMNSHCPELISKGDN